MSASNHMYENLVFEGGGVKGSAYAGCIQVMAEHNLFDNVKRVAGTSAGSITAALLAVGAGSAGLTDSILHSDFKKFVADWGWIFGDIYRLFTRYGIHTGNSFAKILQNDIYKYDPHKETRNKDLTFGQLAALIKKHPTTYKDLTVVASNITKQRIEVFNSVNTPNVPIWQAVRCSMSIPFVFEPYHLNGDYYMDGGLGDIYPIDIFDSKGPDGGDIRNPKTLGFYLEPQNEINNPNFVPPDTKIHSVKSAAEAMFDFLFNSANSKYIHPDDKARTVFIDDLGISATDFGISEKNIKRLIAAGVKATEHFLNDGD